MNRIVIKSMFLVVILTSFGCSPEQSDQPPIVIPVVSVAETPQSESELAFEFEVRSTEPLQSPKKPVMRPPVNRVSRDPFAGKAKGRKSIPQKTGIRTVTQPQPKAPLKGESPKKKPKPELNLGEPNYPTYQKKAPQPMVEAPIPVEVAMGENEAQPVYHPSVKLMEMVDYPWLDVRFFVLPDGSFQASLVKPTGDPILDRIILRTINRWRWKPKTVNGQPVASTVVLRLKRKITPRLHP